jgi:hypothetical protein
MPSPFRFTGILTVIFAACGAARAQELAPPGSGVSIQKLVVDNGPTHTVKYFVKGGSPRLQALVRRVEWAENELSVVEQLQRLKLDTVVNDRRVADFRTAQLTNPYNPPGFIPFPVGPVGGDGGIPLQKALSWQLAGEATPQSALQLIGFLERVQTDLEAELKALPPQEKKAAQGPVDALRPRLAALAGGDVPPPQPQPVVPPPAAQAVPQQPSVPPDTTALEQTVGQNQEKLSQQILQMQQQVKQWLPGMVPQHEPQSMGLPQKGTVSLWPFWACGGLALAYGLRMCLAITPY